MATLTYETRCQLEKRELVAVKDARGHELACESGELWLTVDGEAGDIILAAGERWRIAGDAPVVVSALRPSAFALRRLQSCATPCLIGGQRAVWAPAALLRWRPPLAALPVR